MSAVRKINKSGVFVVEAPAGKSGQLVQVSNVV
jgi:hypothetical protein